MKNFMLNIKMDKASDGTDSTGGSGYSESTDQTTDKTQSEPVKAPERDEFGYTKSTEEKTETEKSTEKKPEEKTADKKSEEKDADVKDPASGYDKEISKPEEKVEEKKPDDKTDEKKSEEKVEEVVLDLKDFSEQDAKSINDFVKENKVPKEIAQAWVDMKRKEITDAVEAQDKAVTDAENAKTEQRRSWLNELKGDSDFGGEKFDHNRKMVDKVLDEFMPLTKKNLTDNKGMLPPYVMRDLLKLGRTLYESKSLTKGEPTVEATKEDEDYNDPTSFYK